MFSCYWILKLNHWNIRNYFPVLWDIWVVTILIGHISTIKQQGIFYMQSLFSSKPSKWKDTMHLAPCTIPLGGGGGGGGDEDYDGRADRSGQVRVFKVFKVHIQSKVL